MVDGKQVIALLLSAGGVVHKDVRNVSVQFAWRFLAYMVLNFVLLYP